MRPRAAAWILNPSNAADLTGKKESSPMYGNFLNSLIEAITLTHEVREIQVYSRLVTFYGKLK
jgi:hypothetical protein